MVIKNKRGWITILEATISVLIVSGVLFFVYANQFEGKGEEGFREYIYSVQKQILMDISTRSDLRVFVLENNWEEVNDYVSGMIPESLKYSVKICELGSEIDHCLLDPNEVIETKELDLYSEQTIVSADVGSGSGTEIFSPKKVRLFIWENRE